MKKKRCKKQAEFEEEEKYIGVRLLRLCWEHVMTQVEDRSQQKQGNFFWR